MLFVVGALWQALTTSVWGMIGGRSVVGLAVGSASFVVPLYISELSPSPFRGRLVTVSSLFITGGQVVAYVVGWAFSARVGGWRWMVGLGALPAALQFCLMQGLPETPRWLVKVGRRELAKQVLGRVYGGKGTDERDVRSLVHGVLRRVEREIYEEDMAAGERAVPEAGKLGWRAKTARINDSFTQLVAVGGNRRALIIACMLQGFQQLCGFVSLCYALLCLPILYTPEAHLFHMEIGIQSTCQSMLTPPSRTPSCTSPQPSSPSSASLPQPSPPSPSPAQTSPSRSSPSTPSTA